MLNETCGQVLVEYSIGLFGKERIDAARADNDGSAVRGGVGILNGIREHEPKPVLYVEKTSGNY